MQYTILELGLAFGINSVIFHNLLFSFLLHMSSLRGFKSKDWIICEPSPANLSTLFSFSCSNVFWQSCVYWTIGLLKASYWRDNSMVQNCSCVCVTMLTFPWEEVLTQTLALDWYLLWRWILMGDIQNGLLFKCGLKVVD